MTGFPGFLLPSAWLSLRVVPDEQLKEMTAAGFKALEEGKIQPAGQSKPERKR